MRPCSPDATSPSSAPLPHCPTAPLRGALFDLRAVDLLPVNAIGREARATASRGQRARTLRVRLPPLI